MKNKFIHYPLVMALMLLFCVPCVTVTYAQSFTVTGTVTDNQGGIPGANVKVKGGTAGTITNMDGQFTLSVLQVYPGGFIHRIHPTGSCHQR